MIYSSVETTVARPPELVWEVLTDIASSTAWVEGLVEVRIDEGDELGEGLEIHCVRSDGARRSSVTSVVTAWRAPLLLALETRARGLLLFVRIGLERLSDGTRLAVHGELVRGDRRWDFFDRPAGLLGAPRDPFADLVQGIFERSVDALVARIEMTALRPYR